MIITAALNNALQAGSAEVVARSVIVSDIRQVDDSLDVVEINTDLEIIEVDRCE